MLLLLCRRVRIPSTHRCSHGRVHTVAASRAIVPHRFALWSLCVDAHKTRDQLLQLDATLLAALPSTPVARLLLPLDGPTALCPFAYARGAHAWSLQELCTRDPASKGHFALSLLPRSTSVALEPEPVAARSPRHEHEYKHEQGRPAGAIATRLLFSNALVNVWDFCVEPQHTCALHEHVLPYVFINRTSGSTRNLDAQLRETGETTFHAREWRFVDVNPRVQRCIHAFENTGTTALQQYVVEFKD